MSESYLTLLFFCVTGETNNFHAVTKSGLNSVQYVSRRHEDDVRKIKRDTQVVVAETVVLFGVQHFEQSGRRVAAKVRAHLVNFVQHYQRIICSRLLDSLNYSPRHCAYICSSMTSNLRLVVNATQRQSHKLSIECSRY